MSAAHPELTDTLLKAVLVRRATGARTSAELVGDVVTAVEALPQRHRWSLWFAPQARLLPVLLVTALLLVTIVAGALMAGSQRSYRGFVEPFIHLPPEGATPSTPETGELLLSFNGRVHGLGLDVHMMWLYADGRLIWRRNVEGRSAELRGQGFGTTEPTRAVIEQRLTPAGAELLRSEAMSAGLSRMTALGGRHTSEARAGGAGVLWGGLVVHDGRQLSEGVWSDPALPLRLADPASWLPADAWQDQRIGGYVPTWYAVCVVRDVPDATAAVLAEDLLHLLPDQTQALLRSRSTGTVDIATNPDGTHTCYRVRTDDAHAISATLEDAGLQGGDSWSPLEYGIGAGVEGQGFYVSFPSILPHGEVTAYGG
jgi:hypothetical protein